MLLGLIGKSNTGKTTFFSACTLVDAEISNRIFTTIEPNKGVTYVRTDCPCKDLKINCNPDNSKCINGTRFVPVKIVDVAGLVPDAHIGRGLGNQFLSDIMEADCLIHVVDISGSTDKDGNPVAVGSNDPQNDIDFLKKEIDYWILGIMKKNWDQIKRKSQGEDFSELLYEQLSGLQINKEEMTKIAEETGLNVNSNDEQMLDFVRALREKNKPILVAANKIDIDGAEDIFNKMEDGIPCSAESELALRRAAEKNLIKYMPGDNNFETVSDLDEKHRNALEVIRNIIKKYGATGVQNIIDKAFFELLNMIVVYPVENEHKFSDKKGNILPHAFLMKRGSTALDMAYKVHQDIGKKFISAVDCKSGKRVSADYELKDGDIISIKAGR